MHIYTASISHMGVHDFKKRALDKTFNKNMIVKHPCG